VRIKEWAKETGLTDWLGTRLRTFDLLPDYLRVVIGHWNDILWGSIPTFPFVIWWFLGSPPVWLVTIIFIWVLLVAGYYAWRKEHLAISTIPSSHPVLVGAMATSYKPAKDGNQTLVQLKVTIWNRGEMSSVVKDWNFSWACGDRRGVIIVAPLYPIDEDESGVGLIDEQPSNKQIIPSGGEAHYTLRYGIPVSTDDISQRGLRLNVTFFDVMDAASGIQERI
jgi:hypothetical protein